MQSKATSVKDYLAELPPERRRAIEAVRKVILKNLDDGIQEGMQYGMIGYAVPHSIYPAGYHCDPRQPLPFAALASQKNYMSLYMMSVYADWKEELWLREQFARAGKKLDMGKCCIRFRTLDDLALDVIGEAIGRVTVKDHIASYESVMRERRKAAPAKKPPVKAAKATTSPGKKAKPAPGRKVGKTVKKAAKKSRST